MKVLLNPNEPLSANDIVELHFKSIGLTWLKAAQIALIEYALKDDPRFEILTHTVEPEQTSVIFKVRVKKTNPIFVTVAVIAAAIMGVGGVTWLLLDKAYKIVEEVTQTPAGRAGVIGLSSLAVVAALGGLLALLPKK